MNDHFNIKCLVPDLPAPLDYMNDLDRMHTNRWYSNFGPILSDFEAEMSQFLANDTCPNPIALTFSSATTALELALKTMELSPSANILMPALTFPATALAALNENMSPVLADVDLNTWALTPALARKYATKAKIDLVMPVAPFGYPIDLQGWADFKAETGIPVLVDAAAALGTQEIHPDIPVCFSLHATKPFGIGEGGLLVTTDTALAERAKQASNFGFNSGKVCQKATNAKMGEYYAAVGRAQIKRFDHVYNARKTRYNWYLKHFTHMNHITLIKTNQNYAPGVLQVHIENKGAEAAIALEKAGIQTRRWYLPTLDKHPQFTDCPTLSLNTDNQLHHCEKLSKSLIGLPFHSFLSENDVNSVCSILKELI